MFSVEEIKIREKDFSQYAKLVPSQHREAVNEANKLGGQTVIHVNSTAEGGGVAEILKSQVGIEKHLGIDSHWHVLKGEDYFFEVTKDIHNMLQGQPGELSEREKNIFIKAGEKLNEKFEKILGKYEKGIVVIHDPQPLALISSISGNFKPIARLHIDLTEPNKNVYGFLQPWLEKYLRVIVSSPDYKPDWLNTERFVVSMPAIDPFSVKNREMAVEKALEILSWHGIDSRRPIIAQVSRFDKWKDPMGVIKAYRIVKEQIPDLQLVLAGFIQAKDDPEAFDEFNQVKDFAGDDKDIYLFADLDDLRGVENDEFINAVYTGSTLMVQKSLREGFGLVVTEAMLKGKAVVGGDATGIKLQIEDGKNGVIVSSIDEAAEKILELLKNTKLRKSLEKEARKGVINNFLLSRLVLDHLLLYNEIKD